MELVRKEIVQNEFKQIYKTDLQGRKQGKYYKFQIIDNSDILLIECNFVNDNLHGEFIEYYPDGKLKKLINYENGEKKGLKIVYNCKNILIKKCYYLYDKKDGLYEEFYDSGDLKKEEIFSLGKLLSSRKFDESTR